MVRKSWHTAALVSLLVAFLADASGQQIFDDTIVKQAVALQPKLKTWRKSLEYMPIDALQLNYKQGKLLEGSKARILKDIETLERLSDSITRQEKLTQDVLLLRYVESLSNDLGHLAQLYGSAYISSGYKGDVDLVMTAKASDQLISTAEEVDLVGEALFAAVLGRLGEATDRITHCDAQPRPD